MVAKKAAKATRKPAKPAVEAKRDVAAPSKQPKPRKKVEIKLITKRDALDPDGATAADLLKKLREEKAEFRPTVSKATFDETAFYDFFGAEIDAMLEVEATIYNDRYARWPCQCCDTVIPVPRRTEVFHGDYHLVHDDVMGLLVNGERWIPKAETPLEVKQPGRLRNPWTGKTLEGKDLGTTGVVG